MLSRYRPEVVERKACDRRPLVVRPGYCGFAQSLWRIWTLDSCGLSKETLKLVFRWDAAGFMGDRAAEGRVPIGQMTTSSPLSCLQNTD